MKQHEQAEKKLEANTLGVSADSPGHAQSPAERRAAARLKPQVQDHIGRQLRAVYDDVLKQPLPDRFRELMEKLDRSTGEPE
ncbi:MAG: NepR family anti-sigma factor [Alsobacter sp.]